jgi:hypothetical protein
MEKRKRRIPADRLLFATISVMSSRSGLATALTFSPSPIAGDDQINRLLQFQNQDWKRGQ